MISRDTLERALPLAQQLEDVSLNVVQGSPLAAIMDTCSTYGLHVEGRNFEELDLGEALTYIQDRCNEKDDNGVNTHHAVVSAFVETSAQSIRQVLDYSRNVVIPDIKAVLEKVEQSVMGVKAAQLEPYVIVQDIDPVVLNNPLLMELVERFSETAARDTGTRELIDLTIDVVKERVATGAAQFDEEVAAALTANNGQGWELVRMVIAGQVALEEIPAVAAIGVHLLAKAIFDNPFEGVAMSLTEYNDRVSLLIEQSGRIVYQELEQIARRKKLGLLYNGGSVPSTRPGVREIHVNQPVYLAMLEKGLTPEALIGNEMLGRLYGDSQLVEKKDELVNQYTREMNLRNVQKSIEDFNLIRRSIEVIIANEIASRADEELVADKGTMQSILKELISQITERDLVYPAILVRNLVCRVFYAHTDCLRFVTLIDDLGEKYPEMSPREVVLIATNVYIALWTCSQVVVA